MQNTVFVCFFFAVLISFCVAACPNWVMYKQCDSKWGSHELGTSSATICSAGCAMSSVAMILASEHVRITNEVATPLTLNNWLVKHGGYVGGDSLVWNAIATLGNVSMEEYVQKLSQADLKKFVDECHPVVANVRGGSHWVLITAATSNPDVWKVNDPGFNEDTYTYSGMVRFVVYKVGKGAVQEGRADLAVAAKYPAHIRA